MKYPNQIKLNELNAQLEEEYKTTCKLYRECNSIDEFYLSMATHGLQVPHKLFDPFWWLYCFKNRPLHFKTILSSVWLSVNMIQWAIVACMIVSLSLSSGFAALLTLIVGIGFLFELIQGYYWFEDQLIDIRRRLEKDIEESRYI